MISLYADFDRIAKGRNAYDLEPGAFDYTHFLEALMDRSNAVERSDRAGFTGLQLTKDSHALLVHFIRVCQLWCGHAGGVVALPGIKGETGRTNSSGTNDYPCAFSITWSAPSDEICPAEIQPGARQRGGLYRTYRYPYHDARDVFAPQTQPGIANLDDQR